MFREIKKHPHQALFKGARGDVDWLDTCAKQCESVVEEI
jgi:hypothetical protein